MGDPGAHPVPMGSSSREAVFDPLEGVLIELGSTPVSVLGASWVFPTTRAVQQRWRQPARPGNQRLDLGSVQAEAG